MTFADSRDGDFSVTQTLEGEGGERLHLNELILKKLYFFL